MRRTFLPMKGGALGIVLLAIHLFRSARSGTLKPAIKNSLTRTISVFGTSFLATFLDNLLQGSLQKTVKYPWWRRLMSK